MNRGVIALVPLLLSIEGCTALLAPGEAQCEAVSDCEARGFTGARCVNNLCVEGAVADPVWGCLGDVVEPEPDKTKKVEFQVRLAYAGDDGPVLGAEVDVCDKLDLDCAGSSANFPKGLTPDAKGNVTINVLQGFDGFVRVTHADVVDSRIFVGRPIVTPPSVKEVQLLRKTEYALLASFAGEDVDPTRGTAIVLSIDCGGESGSGVRFESPNADAASLEFYLINQAPTTPPTATATDVDGFGGFFNLPVSAAVVRAYRDSDDVYIGESSFHVLANTISYVQVAPTPE